MPLPEPEVEVYYRIQYMVPKDTTVKPGDHELGVWYSHAVDSRGYIDPVPAIQAALKEFREVVPYMEWRAVKVETIHQVMDW